jgi:hypothetical protein
MDNLKKEAQFYAERTNLKPWAHVIICTYFQRYPYEPMEYKERVQQSFYDLEYILNASWEITPEFKRLPYVEYILEKYPFEPIYVGKMEQKDREQLFLAYAYQIGLNLMTLPFTVDDFHHGQAPYLNV